MKKDGLDEVRSADKKPEIYTDPNTGKRKVRMVPVDREIVKETGEDLSSYSTRRLSTILRNPNHPQHSVAKNEMLRRKMKNEDKELDEISLKDLSNTIAKSTGTKNINKAMGKDKIKKDLEVMKARLATNEKTLTPAEKKKREEIAKAMEKENPGMDMSKKMAIATATAKRVAEANDDQYHKTLAKTKNSDEGIEALKKKHGMSHDQAKKTLNRLMGVDEAVGTAAKYAGKSGMFGGKYTSKDRMMDMPLDKLNKIRKKRQDQKQDAHMKQDPKMAKMGYAKHMLDTDKADAKAKKRGIDPAGKYDNYKKANNIKDSVQEVLDTPKAMQSYKDKAKYSKDRAANSAAAKMLRDPNGFKSTDTSDELKTMDKRSKGLRMADKAATRKTFKALRAKK